jgi:hypothetical protein
MSTGAWLFAGLIGASLITPVGVYAAVSKVTIGNPFNGATALVTYQHQLLTTTVAPRDLVLINSKPIPETCGAIYVPPEGEALVLLNATVFLTKGNGDRVDAVLYGQAGCHQGHDIWGTSQVEDSEQHTYAAGLPLAELDMGKEGLPASFASVQATGYLIPATQLP